MTKVAVDRVEEEPDGFRLGDPIGCHYHWLDPDEVDAYGDSVRRLATKIELATDGLERTATLSEEVFAGEAADALRARAGRRLAEATLVRDHLRSLGRAINAWSDVLRRHREGLEQLRAYAVSRGLEVRSHRIWPPVASLPGDATQVQADAWEAGWKAYRECFDMLVELRDARRAGARELARALAEHGGVHPDEDGGLIVGANHHQVEFAALRREAAQEAMEAVRANDAAETARRTLDALARREQKAIDDLEELALAGRSPDEVQAQADAIARLHRELIEARAEVRDAEVVAERERAQANRAARSLEDRLS